MSSKKKLNIALFKTLVQRATAYRKVDEKEVSLKTK